MKKEKFCFLSFLGSDEEYLCDVGDSKAKAGCIVALPVGSDGALTKAKVKKIVKFDRSSLEAKPLKIDSVISKKDFSGEFSKLTEKAQDELAVTVTVSDVQLVEGEFYDENVIMLVPYNKDNISCTATVKFSGAYDKEIKVFTDNYGLAAENLILKDEFIYFTNSSDIVKFDINEEKIVARTKLNSFTFNTYEFENGIFIHGETTNTFLDFNLGIKWQYDSDDIFASTESDDIFQMGEGFVSVLDSNNVKHFYDVNGEYKQSDGYKIKL